MELIAPKTTRTAVSMAVKRTLMMAGCEPSLNALRVARADGRSRPRALSEASARRWAEAAEADEPIARIGETPMTDSVACACWIVLPCAASGDVAEMFAVADPIDALIADRAACVVTVSAASAIAYAVPAAESEAVGDIVA